MHADTQPRGGRKGDGWSCCRAFRVQTTTFTFPRVMEPMLSRAWSAATLVEGVELVEEHVRKLRESGATEDEMMKELEASRRLGV